jgi:putative acetyltransferase
MTLTITTEDPLSPEGLALIEGSEAALRAVYTPDECFTFTPEELAAPGISFFVARRNGRPVGCVALADCGDYAEIKRLFVRPEARGAGIARGLMAHLEAAARRAGHGLIRLETGPRLAAALALYRALGYKERGPFGTYADHPASLFMEKRL